MATPTVALTPSQLRRLRVVRMLGGRTGWRVGISQLPGGIVRKVFNLKNPKHAAAFSQEVQMLDRLRGWDLAPQLLFVDLERGETYFQPPGPRLGPLAMLFSSADVNRQRAALAATLENKFGIVRKPSAKTLRIEPIPIRFLRRQRSTKAIAVDGFDDPNWKLIPAKK